MNFSIDREYLTRTLEDLVRINSVNPCLAAEGAGEAEIAHYVAAALERLGLETEIYEPEPGRATAIGRLRGRGGGRSLMLNAHADTVGVENMPAAFQPEIRDGKLWGRGAQDMKASLAAGMAAVKALVEARTPLTGDVVVAAVADEEYGSLGTRDLLTRLSVAGTIVDGAIVTEPTELKLCLAHRGYVWLEVEITGRAAHGSRWDLGIDANIRMGRFLVELEKLADELLTRPAHPLVGPPSLHAPVLHGGNEVSIYAAKSVLQIERRTVPGESEAQVLGEVQAILDRLAAADPTFQGKAKVYFGREPFVTDPNGLLAKTVAGAAQDVLGQPVPAAGVPFWTDAALIGATGIETVLIGPTGAGLHTPGEWVDLESTAALAAILAEAAAQYCQ